jgi:hypothetical protein
MFLISLDVATGWNVLELRELLGAGVSVGKNEDLALQQSNYTYMYGWGVKDSGQSCRFVTQRD